MSWRSTRAAGHGGEGIRQVAVIDLGSNSWRVVVFTYDAGPPAPWWKRTDELYETVRIGAGLESSGKLGEDAIARGLETLAVFARFCRANGLSNDDVHAVATSAIRDATNRDEFLTRATETTGLAIEVLSERDEAYYGYVAAINTSTLTDGVVLEIGGGSMQLVHVADRQALEMESFLLGAVRLTEHFLRGSGPAKRKELERVRQHVRDALKDLDWLRDSGPPTPGFSASAAPCATSPPPPSEPPIRSTSASRVS